MLCRNLLRRQRVSNLLRTYYSHDYSFNNRALDHDRIPSHGRLDFQQQENDFFHKLLASDKQYVNTIAFLDYLQTADENCSSVQQVLAEDYDGKPAYVLLCYLKLVLKSCKEDPKLVENPKAVALCKALTSKIPDLRDEHFWNLMKVLTLWTNKEEHQQFFDLCKAIDEDAVRRSQKWGYDSILLTMDHFYRLRTIRYSEFVFDAMKRLWRNPTKLTPQQVVHAMFLVKTYTKWHQGVNLLEVESALTFFMYDLSVEEVGVLAVAFYKTHTAVRDINLVDLMYNKLETRIDNVDPLTITAFLKFFRLCTTRTLEHKMWNLLDRLTSRVDELPTTCCMHLALLGIHRLVFHEPAIRKVCEKLYDNMQSLRLKDIEKLALVLQLFNYVPESRSDIIERMIGSIRQRDEEVKEHPSSFVSALFYLSLMGHYDHDLVNRALSIDFLKKTYGSISPYSIPTSVVYLSVGVKMECPDYKGSHLAGSFTDIVAQKFCRIPSESKKSLGDTWVNLFSIRNTACKIFGSGKYAHLIYLLPYLPLPDVIFYVEDKKPVELLEAVLYSRYLPSLPPPNSGGQWYALTLMTKMNVIRQSNRLTGHALAKLRHLNLLGVKTIQINEEKYEKEVDKLRFVKDLIDEHIK